MKNIPEQNQTYAEPERNNRNYKEEKGGGGLNIGFGCRSIALTCGFLIVLGVGLFLYLLFFKSSLVLSKFSNLVNDGLVENQITTTENASAIRSRINSQITHIGENEVLISEDELTVIARDHYKNLRDLNVKVQDDSLVFYWSLVKIADSPFFAMVQLQKVGENNLGISKIGLGRVTFPKTLSDKITKVILGKLNLQNNDNQVSIIYQLLSSSGNYEIEKITFDGDRIKLVINVSVEIFQ